MGIPVRYLAEAAIGFGGCGAIIGVAFLAARRWSKRLGVDDPLNDWQKGSIEL